MPAHMFSRKESHIEHPMVRIAKELATVSSRVLN